MSKIDVETLLSKAIAELSRPKNVEIDQVIDDLMAIAVRIHRIEAMGHDQISFVLGDGIRKSFYFDDCIGRFRIILARLFIRCQESLPFSITGGIYGFEGRMSINYDKDNSADMFVKTKNDQAYPELLIEMRQS